MMETGHNGLMLLCSSEELMISMVDEYRAAIRSTFDALPEGTWAEIVDGEIEVSPFPSDTHQLIVRYLLRLLAANIPESWDIEPAGGLIIEPDMQEYRPDIYIAPAEAWRVSETPGADPGQVELVVEVVSPGKRDRERDRVAKYRAYAHVGIPFYLLVDRYEGGGFVTLYSNPSDGQYLDAHKVPFGEKLRLPAPFEVEIDTARF
jgi:Uma2 family endonuclease